MTAKLDFRCRREPAQPVAAMPFAHDESGLREIVLVGDPLQQRVVEPAFKRNNCCGIAFEHPLGEGIDLPKTKLHF